MAFWLFLERRKIIGSRIGLISCSSMKELKKTNVFWDDQDKVFAKVGKKEMAKTGKDEVIDNKEI